MRARRRRARCRRPMSITGQAPPASPATSAKGPGNEIVDHRIAHPPQSARPAIAGRLRRPAGHPEDRPQLDHRRASAPAERGRRPQHASSTIRATSATRPTAAASAPARRKSTFAISARSATLVLVDGLRFVNGASASGVPGSVDLNAIPESMIERVEVLQDGASAIYGSDAIAGVVNIITKRRQEGFVASAQLGEYLDEGDGFTQNYQLSWGNGDDGPTQIVVGGNYVKQNGVFARRPRRFRAFPDPVRDSCARRRLLQLRHADSAASFVGCVRTLDAEGAGDRTRRPTPDRLSGDFTVRPGRPLQLRAVQLHPDSARALRRLRQLQAGARATTSISRVKALWNRRKSKNQAAPLPLFVGPTPATATCSTRSRSTPPIRSIRSESSIGLNLDGTPNGDCDSFIGRRVVEGGPRRFDQKVDTGYGTATLDGKFGLLDHDWYWDVNGIYGRNKAKQMMHGNFNAANLAQALGPVAQLHRRLRAVQHLRRRGLDHAGRCSTSSASISTTAASRSCGASAANASGGLVRSAGRPARASRSASNIAISRAGSIRIRSSRRASARIFRRCRPRAATRSTKLYARAQCADPRRTCPAPSCSSSTAPCVISRLFEHRQRVSHTTFKGSVNWKPISDLRLARRLFARVSARRRIGELFGTPSRFDQEVHDPCSARPESDRARCSRTASRMASQPGMQQINVQLPVITGGNEDLAPETSKGWNVGAVLSPSHHPALLDRGELLQHQGQGRDPGDQRQHDAAAVRVQQ